MEAIVYIIITLIFLPTIVLVLLGIINGTGLITRHFIHKLDPNYKDAYINKENRKSSNLGNNRAKQYFNKFIKSGYYTGPIQDFNIVIELDPEDKLAYYSIKFGLGDDREHIQDLNKIIELDPEDKFAYYYRAFCKSRLGDETGAKQDYYKAMKIDPDIFNIIHKFYDRKTNG
jgi:tetratricopeptide (TPR) repeat protein